MKNKSYSQTLTEPLLFSKMFHRQWSTFRTTALAPYFSRFYFVREYKIDHKIAINIYALGNYFPNESLRVNKSRVKRTFNVFL